MHRESSSGKARLEATARHNSQYAEIEERALAPIKWAATQDEEEQGKIERVTVTIRL